VVEVEVNAQPDLVQRERDLAGLRRMIDDAEVAGVLLRLDGAPGGWATVAEWASVVRSLRVAGKVVLAFVEAPGSALMAIAAACDAIAIVPTGEVALVGVGTEITFFGKLLERWGLQPDFLAAGAYKSFGEPFTRSYPSTDNQEAMTALVRGLHEQFVEQVARGRSLPAAAVSEAVERAPLSAHEAREAGLVDALLYEDQLEGWVKERIGRSCRMVSGEAWARADAALVAADTAGRTGKSVVVVPLSGNIVVDAPGVRLAVRARRIVPILRSLRENPGVGAVVLHVDSPGGSALASDLIWREVDLLRAQKPVVAVFGDVAASGGYYLAAPAHEILARYGTLTGSIGVFGGKIVVGEGLRKLGITSWPIAGGANANLFSANRRFDNGQRVRFQASLQRFYDGFVDRVAAGRGKPAAEVEPYCRGRVWTGADAVRVGLVDAEGGVFQGITRAASLAGMSATPRVGWARTAAGSAFQRAARRALPGAARAAFPELTSWLPGVDASGFSLLVSGEPLAWWPDGLAYPPGGASRSP
jgi:protease-4